jgi:HEAT repeat protein
VPGGLVCVKHGGKAPQVQAKARERLLVAADPAAGVLIELLGSPEESIRLKAAIALLDRTGHGTSVTQVQVDGGKVKYEIAGVDLEAL